MTNSEGKIMRHVLVGNEKYGLYIGETSWTDEEIIARHAVSLINCRHVSWWYGRTGGITSLAAHGPCGPRAGESRVGAPTSEPSLLMGVVNVFGLTQEAILAFSKIVASCPDPDPDLATAPAMAPAKAMDGGSDDED